MNIYEDIGKIAIKIIVGEDQTTIDRINLYSSGLEAKLRNSEYAFFKLKELSGQSNSSISTSGFTTGEMINFYLDSFFAFLYSSFDVIAQIINQKMKLGNDEHVVSFKRVKQSIDQRLAGSNIQQAFDKILRTIYFRNLEKYRNCSTHRRQIYIQCKMIEISGTKGYTTSGEFTIIERIICDDPLSLIPTVRQNKELINYCQIMLERTQKEISKILKTL